ncbi:MAG: hypothetical protein A2Z38_04890 [Planctomycetes bacterium RBG_19FT_COMBO_48_8]|nr:MAG: hypothetical protein A2173_08870 [Planctomycetes bacterium RBG_13_44_8b]OHB83918.1 MAG: hypothetical protein A2Z38_04890 [Planctomycetes bacterium RBG_19FT_COMBO_48_8]
MNWLKTHFQKHRKRKPWNFCWRVAIEGLIVSFIIVYVLLFFIEQKNRDFFNWPISYAILVILILAPVFETLLFQTLPVAVARWRKARFRVQILVSLIPFTLVHLVEGIAVGVGAGLIGGFYLAINYVHWREKSLWTALWTTTIAHAIRNIPAAIIILLIPGSA